VTPRRPLLASSSACKSCSRVAAAGSKRVSDSRTSASIATTTSVKGNPAHPCSSAVSGGDTGTG